MLDGARYDGRRSHVESWFVKANDPKGDRALWLKWTIFAPKRAPERAIAEAWAVAFVRGGPHVAVKSTVPIARARFARDTLEAAVDGAKLDAGSAEGAVSSGDRRISFDLAFEARGAPFYMWPRAWMYEARVPPTKISSPVADARASGAIDVDGESWRVDAWPAMIGHNWGPRNTHFYAWSHCNAWDDAADLVVEGFTGRARWTPFVTVVVVRRGGVTRALNGLVDLLRARGEIAPRRWKVHARAPDIDVRGEVWAETGDMVGLHYANPDAPMSYCLNTKLARARFEIATSEGTTIARSRAAALEICTRDPRHGVRMYL
jgi:hypothetical protein